MDADNGEYDEFGFLAETAEEYAIAWTAPKVERVRFEAADGQFYSALKWGETSPEVVFFHGGGQNAHTWDTVALALGKPAIAFDLLGHGHSAWRGDKDYSPWANVEQLVDVLPTAAPDAKVVVGMSLGGATTIRLAAERPDLVKKAVIVDVSPQVNDPTRAWSRDDRGTVALTRDAPVYESFEAMAEAAIKLSPNRSPQSTRRGVRHNARRLHDGTWTWRYDQQRAGPRPSTDFFKLWDDVSRITSPAMLVVGGASVFVLPADVAEMKRRLPSLRVETVAGAGHAVQSDRPLELAALIRDFAF